jgi:hypothetical protein
LTSRQNTIRVDHKPDRTINSGSLAMFTAILRALSLLSNLRPIAVPGHQADFRDWTAYARTTIASGCLDLIGLRRFGRLFLALRLPFEPLPHQRVCSRPFPAPPAHFVRRLLPVPLLWSLVLLRPWFAVVLPLLAVDRLPHWRVYPGSLLPTPLRFGRRSLLFGCWLSAVAVLSVLSPLPRAR